MRYFWSAPLIVGTVIAFFYASRILYNNNHKKITYRFFTYLSIMSGFWSLGYGMMLIVESERAFIIFRIIGAMAALCYVVVIQTIIGHITERLESVNKLIIYELTVGAIVGVFSNVPSYYTLTHTQGGIICRFTSPVMFWIVTGYTVIVCAVTTMMTFGMTRKSMSARTQAIGNTLLKLEGYVLVGIVLDYLFPLIGADVNIPFCAILQHNGLEMFYRMIHRLNKNSVAAENMPFYIYRSVRTPILTFDSEYTLLLANEEARKMFDIEENDIENTSYNFWVTNFGHTKHAAVHDVRETTTIEASHLKKDINCQLAINPIYDEFEELLGYIVVVTDMTEHYKNLREVEAAKVEAEKANLAKSQFLANMSHEIRTPMNAILGFTELALQEDEKTIPPKANEYFTDIETATEGLLYTINSILDISKIESGKMELSPSNYNTADLIKELSVVIGAQAKKRGIDFIMDIDESLPSVLYGDKDRVREILLNLLSNALKYTEEGYIKFSISVIGIKKDIARLRMSVADTGIGIQSKDLNAIFESFKRVDLARNKKTEGTGLGLSITKGFANLMDGDVTVESTPGVGSTFTVEIAQEIVDREPVNLDKSKKQVKELGEKKLIFKNVRFLAVDDSTINLKVISRYLELYDSKCDLAQSGIESIDMCKENNYDIIFMDQMMPKMDGVETMKNIRELGNGYELNGANKIIALTANSLAGVKEEMIDAGFDDYITKPVNMKILETTILKYLTTDQYEYVEK